MDSFPTTSWPLTMDELRAERGRVANLVRSLEGERFQAETDRTRLTNVVAFA